MKKRELTYHAWPLLRAGNGRAKRLKAIYRAAHWHQSREQNRQLMANVVNKELQRLYSPTEDQWQHLQLLTSSIGEAAYWCKMVQSGAMPQCSCSDFIAIINTTRYLATATHKPARKSAKFGW